MLNDYLIKLNDENENDDRVYGRHFEVKFILHSMKYYIKDLGNGFGAFMKIKDKYQLLSDSLINIGDAYIVVSIGDEDINTSNDYNEERNTCVTTISMNLNLKIYSGTIKFDPM